VPVMTWIQLVSGVRSSCEALATNLRCAAKAPSSRSSRASIVSARSLSSSRGPGMARRWLVAILAVLAISNEYSTGMIRVTLAAMPRRGLLLAAKAILVTGLVLVAGAVAAAGSLLAGRLILPGHGFTAARGFLALSLADGTVLRATAGAVLYLGLIALLSLGVAALVREPAVAIGVVLGLLYLFPIIVQVAGADPSWQRHLEQIGPMEAGLAIEATTGLRSLPIGPWAGLGVLAAWAAVALLGGALVLRYRDA
jgi:ABC-2 type transport system permease protein